MRHIYSCLLRAQEHQARPLGPHLDTLLVECSCLSNDQQGHVGNDIEDQKENFEQPEERVDDHIEGFSGNGKPFALRAIY